MPSWTIFLLFFTGSVLTPFALIIGNYLWNQHRLTKIKTAALLHRQPLDCISMLREYFPELSIADDEFGKIWLPLGDALCIDPKYLRPDDRLDDRRIITTREDDYEIDVWDKLNFQINVNRVFFRKFEVAPEHPPVTLRDFVYQCLGQDHLIES